MCDFEPGDEVVCIRSDSPKLIVGSRYTICYVGSGGTLGPWVGVEGLWRDDGSPNLWCPSRFRKVQRRDLTAWLATENAIEEPKRIRETESA